MHVLSRSEIQSRRMQTALRPDEATQGTRHKKVNRCNSTFKIRKVDETESIFSFSSPNNDPDGAKPLLSCGPRAVNEFNSELKKYIYSRVHNNIELQVKINLLAFQHYRNAYKAVRFSINCLRFAPWIDFKHFATSSSPYWRASLPCVDALASGRGFLFYHAPDMFRGMQ